VPKTVVSKNGVPIRLTDKRWVHITEEHTELAGYRLEVLEAIAEPERIVAGGGGELLAVRRQENGKLLVVVYGELARDGLLLRHS